VKFPIRLGKFKSTRILAGASGLLLALTLVVAFVSPVSAVPQQPHKFWGTVSIDSVPAPEGTEVVARIANVTQNFTTVVAANHTYGWSPVFHVLGDDPDTPEKEGGNDGDTIDFYVAGIWATNFTWKVGGHNELNLTVPGYNLTVNVTPVGGGNVTVNGVTPSSYPNTTTWVCDKNVTLNAAAASGYIFVNWSGDLSGNTNPTNITMDSDKNVTANFAEVTAATLEGHVSFIERGTAPNSRWIESFTVKGFEVGNLTNVIWAGNATTNNTGVFTISGLTPGTYDIGIKNWTCLSEVNTSVTLTVGNTTAADFGTTREGDIDNNDWIYLSDMSAFSTAWNTKPGDGPWNAAADLDRNDWVYLGDLSLFCTNWDQKGEAYGHF